MNSPSTDEKSATIVETNEENSKSMRKGVAAIAVGMIVTFCMIATLNNTQKLNPQFVTRFNGLRFLRSDPKVVWLVSFPDSGASQLLYLIQAISNKTCATNYGMSMIDSEAGTYNPVLSDPTYTSRQILSQELGPLATSDLELPKYLVLTRTHSFGTCHNCPPWNYMGPSAERHHKHANTRATRFKDGAPQTYQYEISNVHKTLVLFRDPMDIVVARFVQQTNKNPAISDLYAPNINGFKQYCSDQNNNKLLKDWERNWYEAQGYWEEANDVPCYAEFVKIFNFYNMIRILALDFKLPMQRVSYKDMVDNTDETTDEVLKYLNLERVNETPEVTIGDDDKEFFFFYTSDERKAIATLAKKIALPWSWDGMSPFLEHYL